MRSSWIAFGSSDMALAANEPDPAPAYTPAASTTAQLPAHGSLNHELPPAYPTSLPEEFPIGAVKAPPVVSVSELQDHLRLLGAFATLRKNVEATADSKEDSDAAWAIYVARAVYRFHRWVSVMNPQADGSLSDDGIPPIDVLMVWHSYALVSFPITIP